jgi:hypothetical protein
MLALLTGPATIGKMIHHRVTEVTEKKCLSIEHILLDPKLVGWASATIGLLRPFLCELCGSVVRSEFVLSDCFSSRSFEEPVGKRGEPQLAWASTRKP